MIHVARAVSAPSDPQASLLERWRIPVDAVALLVIAIVVVLSHRPFIRQGVCFNDASWYFHFGHRLIAGDVPYRDYIFQVGPLPIYIDAGFQELFGGKYMASLYAALAIKIIRVFVVWMLVRRLASVRAAALVAVFCILDPLFAFVYHWSTPYAQLFIALSGLFLLLASRAEGRRALLYLAVAGFSAGFIVSVRQSTAVMIGIVGIAVTGVMFARAQYFTRQRFVALWAGFAIAFVAVFAFLALQGALGAAIQQMFLDAPAKKGVQGLDAILDAISGGALLHARYDPSFTWWTSFLYFIGLPIALVIAAFQLGARDRDVSGRTLANLAVPAVMILGLVTRYASLSFYNDVPRTFFTALVALAVLSPPRVRAWFGLEPIVVFALAGLPLASDWALEISNPGRGWGDPTALNVGVILVALASVRLSERAKLLLCAGLAAAGLIHLGSSLRSDVNPFGNDGLLGDTTYAVKGRELRGMRMTLARKKIVDWMRSEVRPDSTCFVYGNLPALYTLLECKNPTRVDSTAADFLTASDAEAAIATLQAAPPDYILAHERSWLNPPLSLEVGRDLTSYNGMNPRASMTLHEGLRALLSGYESVGLGTDVIGPELAKQTSDKWDIIDQVRIYRRKP